MHRTISTENWQQIKTAYAAGIGLREMARNMGIPEGTVLARAKREGWTREIQNAQALKARAEPSVRPTEAAAITLQERGERHLNRIAGVTEKVLPYLEDMAPDEILSRVHQVEKLDKIARRTFRLDDNPTGGFTLNLGITIGGMD